MRLPFYNFDSLYHIYKTAVEVYV